MAMINASAPMMDVPMMMRVPQPAVVDGAVLGEHLPLAAVVVSVVDEPE
jgi:hypothetical protein